MSNLAGETGLAVIQLAIQDHTHSKAPAEVDEQHIVLHSGLLVGEVLSKSHCPGVILDVHGHLELVLEDGLEGKVVTDKVAEAVAFLRVDPSGKAYAHSVDLVPGDALLRYNVLDYAANLFEGVRIGLKDKFYVLDKTFKVALEIRDGYVEVPACYINAHEIPGIGIEAEYTGTPSTGGALLAKVLEESFRDKFLH